MGRIRGRLACGCAATSLLIGANPAHAQDTAASPQPQPDLAQPAGLEDIIVTARRTTETLQKAPVAVTTVAGDALARAGITNLGDLQGRLPSVEFTPATSIPIIYIRGVGTFSTQTGVDSAVAYTIDGIFAAHPQSYPPVLVDIARVEALRGPQGTLYGRNSNGGAVNFLTNEPKLETVEATAALTYGNYDALATEAVLNVPVGDDVAVRGAFGSERHDSYYPTGYNDAHNNVARVRLLYKPTNRLRILLSADRYRLHNNGTGYDECPPNGTNPNCAGVPFRKYTGSGPRDPNDFNRIKTWGVYGQIDLTLDWATLISLTSYRDNEFLVRQSGVFGANNGFIQGATSKFFTQELRLSAPSDSPIKWLIGGYYADERGPSTETFYNGPVNYFLSNPVFKSDSKAAFGEITVPIVDGFRVTGGIRYTDETKSAEGPITLVGATTTTVNVDDQFHTKKVTWKAGAEFDVADQSLLYGTVSTGFKSGGINQVPSLPGFTSSYRPETITAYQIGSKNRFLSNRLQLNAEAFYYDYSNLQAIQLGVDPTGQIPGFFIETTNSQKARMYGGELEAALAITPHDRLTAALALLRARFKEYIVGATDLSGNQIQGSPKYALSGNYEHVFEFDNGSRLTFGVDSKLVAGHYMSNNNEPGAFQNRYTRTNANLTYLAAGGHWQLTAFVKNIENGAQQLGFVPRAESDLVLLYPPRTYGGTFRCRF